MRLIVQHSVRLPGTPRHAYDSYLDAVAHAAFTGGAAIISPVIGAEFSGFDGRISGRILNLTPGREIVQTWRSFEWQADELDSILVLLFSPEGPDTQLHLTQMNVPERMLPTLQANWPMRYLDPWRAYLESHP